MAAVDVQDGVEERVYRDHDDHGPQRDHLPPLFRADPSQEQADDDFGQARDENVKDDGDPAIHHGGGPLLERHVFRMFPQAIVYRQQRCCGESTIWRAKVSNCLLQGNLPTTTTRCRRYVSDALKPREIVLDPRRAANRVMERLNKLRT